MELIVSSLLAPALRPLYEGVAERIARATGAPVTFVEGHREGFDLAFLCSPQYLADPSLVALAAPVPAAPRYGGRPVYFSDVIVRAGHPARTMAELHGTRWSFNEVDSYSGFGALAWYAHEAGDEDGFGTLVRVGSHAASIEHVSDGRVDAAVIDSVLLDFLFRDDPALERRVRVICSLGPAPIQPLVAHRRVPGDVRLAVIDAVVSMHSDPAAAAALAHGGVARFVSVGRSDYEVVEERLAVIARRAAAVS